MRQNGWEVRQPWKGGRGWRKRGCPGWTSFQQWESAGIKCENLSVILNSQMNTDFPFCCGIVVISFSDSYQDVRFQWLVTYLTKPRRTSSISFLGASQIYLVKFVKGDCHEGGDERGGGERGGHSKRGGHLWNPWSWGKEEFIDMWFWYLVLIYLTFSQQDINNITSRCCQL